MARRGYKLVAMEVATAGRGAVGGVRRKRSVLGTRHRRHQPGWPRLGVRLAAGNWGHLRSEQAAVEMRGGLRHWNTKKLTRRRWRLGYRPITHPWLTKGDWRGAEIGYDGGRRELSRAARGREPWDLRWER